MESEALLQDLKDTGQPLSKLLIVCFHPDYCYFITSSVGRCGIITPPMIGITVCQRLSPKSLLVISRRRLPATIQVQK